MSEYLKNPDIKEGEWIVDPSEVERIKGGCSEILSSILAEIPESTVGGSVLLEKFIKHPQVQAGLNRYSDYLANTEAKKWYKALPPDSIILPLAGMPESPKESVIPFVNSLVEKNAPMRRIG